MEGGDGDGDGDGDELISTVPPPPPPEISPVRSPDDDLEFHEEEEEEVEPVEESHEEDELLEPSSAADPLPSSTIKSETAVLTDDLKEKIIKQVEYYFSDENLPTDKFLMKYVAKDKDGFVPVAVVASFRKMKKLVHDKSLLVAALRESSQLILSSSGKKVRRVHPLPITEVKDAKLCTVVVENLPENCSKDDLRKIFGEVGKISSISIRDPHGIDDSAKVIKGEVALSGKRHALVEYETVKEAEKAVASLNDEKSWRNGMHVELLFKRMSKYGLTKRGWKGVSSEKNDNVPASHMASNEQNVKSLDHHDETPEQEETHHSLNEKVGRNRRGNRGRGQGQSHYRGSKPHYSNGHGHGHGSAPTSSRSEVVQNKPPPGPRMPDGTRGFAMGRGRPPTDHIHE